MSYCTKVFYCLLTWYAQMLKICNVQMIKFEHVQEIKCVKFRGKTCFSGFKDMTLVGVSPLAAHEKVSDLCEHQYCSMLLFKVPEL